MFKAVLCPVFVPWSCVDQMLEALHQNKIVI